MTKKEKNQIAATGALIIILVICIIINFGGKKKLPEVLSDTSQEQSSAPALDQKNKLFVQLQEQAKNLDFKRDPFSKNPIELSHGPHLRGVMWDEKNPTALINDQVVGKGSIIEGSKVVEIRKDRVILNNETGNVELILGQ